MVGLDHKNDLLIGRIVHEKTGRNKGEFSVIVGKVDRHLVLLADGDKRKFERPKKKNLNHLHLYKYVSPEVKNSILQTGRVTDGKLRHALHVFRSFYLAREEGTN